MTMKSYTPSALTTTVSAMLAGMVLASSAHADPEIAISSSAGGSTTVVEQYSDGKTATITATPNGITMQDGMPYAVTKVTTVPRYVVRQSPVVQGSTTVTSVPVTNRVTNSVTKVDVVTAPVSTVTQALPVTTATPLPVMNAPATTVITNQPSIHPSMDG